LREDKKSLSEIIQCALFSGIALVIFAVEACIPIPIPIPGIKLGLANVVTLVAIYLLGRKQAFMILIVRILLGNFITGQMMALIYSMAGGMLCYVITATLKPCFNGKTIWALGTLGAIFHNIGQLVCAYFMLGKGSILYYGFILTGAACITGTFTGLVAQHIILHNHFKKS